MIFKIFDFIIKLDNCMNIFSQYFIGEASKHTWQDKIRPRGENKQRMRLLMPSQFGITRTAIINQSLFARAINVPSLVQIRVMLYNAFDATRSRVCSEAKKYLYFAGRDEMRKNKYFDRKQKLFL